VSPGWREVGGFLGPNISRFCQSYPVGKLEQIWSELGIEDIHVKRLSLGGAVVMWGTKSGG
jgi:demethylmenaquinone methyltransferase/2-methoxy-6-polyprenyl-1,4-benzoquinol methylase